MITTYELDEINRMSVEDPGMADLLNRVYEYYLLKRPTPRPPSQSANDILDKIRARSIASKVGRPSTFTPTPTPTVTKPQLTLKELAALLSRQVDDSDETE